MNRACRRWGLSLLSLLVASLIGCGSDETAAELGHGDLATTDSDAADGHVVEERVDANVTNDVSSSTMDAPALPTDDASSTPDAPSGIDRMSTDGGAGDSGPDPGLDSRSDVNGDVGSLEASTDSGDAKSETGDGGNVGIIVNVCPEILAYSASPPTVTVGGDVHLTSVAHDDNGDVLSFQWTATQGTFTDASAANTTFHCAAVGKATLTLVVSDGKCDDAIDQDIQCN